MRRRELFGLVGASAALWSLSASAQTKGKVWRIGILGTKQPTTAMLQAFREALRERGYREGQNLLIDVRWLEDKADPVGVVTELIHRDVNVIVAWATPAVIAASRATTTIPIVMIGAGDPVGRFVTSLAHPGGNITGTSNLSTNLGGKIVELLVEIVPGIKRVGIVRNPDNPGVTLGLQETKSALQKLDLHAEVFEASTARALESAFASFVSNHVEGVIIQPDPSIIENQQRIAELAKNARLPTVFQRRENVEAGGLLSYGPNLNEQWRTTASYIDRIFKGALPAELPVEQPTGLELVINRRTAGVLGLSIPPSLLARADEVIE